MWFGNTYKFTNYDISKFILLLRKGVYPYDYMGDWENLMRHHYQKKKIFMMEDITEAHYEHAKRVCKDFE